MTSFSFGQESVAVFKSSTSNPFYLIIDGTVQNVTPKPVVKLNLNAGLRNVRVIFDDPGKGQILRSVPIERGKKSIYVVRTGRGNEGIFLNSSTYFNQSSGYVQNNQVQQNQFERQGYYCSAGTVSDSDLRSIKSSFWNKPVVEKRDYLLHSISTNCWYARQVSELVALVEGQDDKLEVAKLGYVFTYDTQNYDQVLDQLPGYKREEFMRYAVSKPDPSNTNIVFNQSISDGARNNSESVSSSSHHGGSISAAEFQMIVDAIRNESFSSGKLAVVQEMVQSYSLTTDHVKKLLVEFSFEADKLEVAKKCYASVIDQRGYVAALSDEFTFSSSREELRDFIK